MTLDPALPYSLASEIRSIRSRLLAIETKRGGSSVTLGGSSGSVQYSDGSNLAGDSTLTYNSTTGALSVGTRLILTNSSTAGEAKITLWDNGSTTYGFGISSQDLDYFSDVNHRWHTGSGGGSAGTEVMSLTGGANTPILTLKGSDSSYAEFRAHGTSQGTGVAYVGQSSTYGGGIFYNGDGSPAYATGEAADRISFFRRSNGTNEVVFSYPYNTNHVDFRGNVNVSGDVNTAKVNLSTSVHLTNVDADGSMRVEGNNGYIEIGPKNSGWCHIYTDRAAFYFNKELRVNGYVVSTTDHTHSYAATNHTHSYASTSSAVRALYYNGYGNSEITAYQTSGNWQTWTGGWATHIIGNHGNGSNYYNQTLVMPFWGGPYYMRKQGGGNVGPYLVYTSEHVNKSSADWTIGRAYVHNEVFVYNMDTTWSYNTLRYNTSNSQLMAYASLREMKTDITEIQPLLDYLGERSLIYDLRPVIFRESDDRIGKDGEPLKTTRGEFAPGFIAEEVHEVAPELTYFDHKGDLISYSNDALIPHLVAELQRLAPMVESLYGDSHHDYIPPAPRPTDRGATEKAIYDLAAAEKAEHPTEFLDRPDEEMPPSFDLPDPPEVEIP